jgi:serine phosphatase RsbU (regulator of sigma subunit)
VLASADGAGTVRVLLVEDDEGDAVLVTEWLSEVTEPLSLTWVRTLAEAENYTAPVDCMLLDLGLSDAFGLDGVKRLQASVPTVAIVVLTGHHDARQGTEAVAAGAQDYLVKGQVTGELLARTIRYAVQRQRAESAETALLEERIHAQENVRLERGLLPQPIVRDPGLVVTSRYRSGGQRMLLGGDFFDAIEAADGSFHTIIGDVAGHGPDQAALGVALRIAWRTLILAERPDVEVLPVLAEVLAHERHDNVIFTTVCTITVAPDRRSVQMFLAGHPAPLILTAAGCSRLPQEGGPALGLVPGATWTPVSVAVPAGPWEILLYTDGAIEGHLPATEERLGVSGLVRLIGDMAATSPRTERDPGLFLDAVIARITELNSGPLTDDLAMLCIGATGADTTGTVASGLRE